ncbi:RHS repeat-associated core domain-containing protein, partial [Arenimonas composti]
GSPIATTNDTGTAVSYNRQTAYGEPADGSWENGPGFTGHVVDAGSRLVYMQQRYYDPAIGRFISADPIYTEMTSGGFFSRYNYSGSNPLKFKDPDGRAVKCVGGVCTMTADTFDPQKSNGKTLDVTPEMREGAEKSKHRTRSDGNRELSHYLVQTDSGEVRAYYPTNAETRVRRARGGTVVGTDRPEGAVAIVHGHNERGERKSDGFVDKPELNEGYGDTEGLLYDLPVATIYRGQVAWHTIRGGQLVFEFPEGSATPTQIDQLQINLNNQQLLFQDP